MRKGNIVLVPFPFTDLSRQKVRPALVVYTGDKDEDCIVVFLTSQNQKKLSLFDIKITPSRQNGLKTESIIRINKMATLQKKVILGELGNLDQHTLIAVEKKLKLLFQL